jgi:hypothetical protein
MNKMAVTFARNIVFRLKRIDSFEENNKGFLMIDSQELEIGLQ